MPCGQSWRPPAAKRRPDIIARAPAQGIHDPPREGLGHASKLRAVGDVSFEIREGETLGLVGESGCGKSTLGRVILGCSRRPRAPSCSTAESSDAVGPPVARHRRELQVVFQDPYASLDPRMTVAEIVAEPLRIKRMHDAERVNELLGQVGLIRRSRPAAAAEFSGGQRQRIAIARALALRPDLLILDEAVSALDVSIQAQVINLLKELQQELGLAYLFISHDLSVVRHISDRVAVMYLGRIVETGTRAPSVRRARSPLHAGLAVGDSEAHPAQADRTRIILKGDLPDPLEPPSGCAFRTRCFKAEEICARLEPELAPRTGPAHLSACHFAGSTARIDSPAIVP